MYLLINSVLLETISSVILHYKPLMLKNQPSPVIFETEAFTPGLATLSLLSLVLTDILTNSSLGDREIVMLCYSLCIKVKYKLSSRITD